MALETVSVIGGGAWGTALAQAAAMAGRRVTLVVRNEAVANEITASHTHGAALGAQKLLVNISAALIAGPADIFILAVPAQATRAALRVLDPALLLHKPVVLSAKGLEAGTLDRQSQILAEMAPTAVPFVLSGPSFAADLAAGRPTAVTLAGDDADQTAALAAALAGPSFRP